MTLGFVGLYPTLGCSVMRNSRLKIVKGEFLTCFDYYDEFHVRIYFSTALFIDRCAHIWVMLNYQLEIVKDEFLTSYANHANLMIS